MANTGQLRILKQGVDAWNEWRIENNDVAIDLSRAELYGADLWEANLRGAKLNGIDLTRASLDGALLNGANLRQAILYEANLSGADLSAAELGKADLRKANLQEADLLGTNLTDAELGGANLSRADLAGANFSGADLSEANLKGTYLKEANFREAYLFGADLGGAKLSESHFVKAVIGETIFGNSDLSEAIGLENIEHTRPSSIATDVFFQSKGKIPVIFLQGCGLSDWEIEEVKLYNPEMSNNEVNETLYKVYELRATRALQISPLFISYSHVDSEFVDRVGDSLTEKGVRYWRDKHDLKAGRIEKQIDLAISQNPTVLLVLSEYSLKSDWVEHEVRKAREVGKEMGRDVLCPVALDDTWKSSRWPKRITEQIMEYNILDFSEWKDDSKFDGMFRKLIDGLELFYKG